MTTWSLLGRFFHGLTFFTLGLTVSFIQYRSRRVLLAQRLFWLALFAFGEAAAAWIYLLSSQLTSPKLFAGIFYPAILTIGYVHLLAFGLQTLIPDNEKKHHFTVRQVLFGICGLGIVLYLAAFLSKSFDNAQLVSIVEVLIRYGLAFPGGLLTAIGLRRQSYHTLDPKLRNYVRGYLQLVEVMAGIFGIFNLILVPPILFFPASRVNVNLFHPAITEWIWVSIGVGLTWGLTGALSSVQLEIEEWIEGVEHLQALAVERERIGRDLHDGIIQSIYAAGLLLESLQQIIPRDPERAQAQLGRVMDNLNETIQDIRRYIFDLRSDMPDSDLSSGIERLLRDFRINTLLETELEIMGTPVEILSIERRRHIFQIVREALTNTARHAKASKVKIRLHYANALDLTISDDGIGMETLLISKGYGLRNIRERTRLLEGTIRVESAPGAGVTFHLTVPY
ncbi:MAG: sensor histidine kinase [Anaerolineae bacterium]|nr:sensor histidine kinase [Anaerolineae bacterium]